MGEVRRLESGGEYWISAEDILRECRERRDENWEQNFCGAAISMDEVCRLLNLLLG